LRRNPGSLPIREIESSIAEVFLGGLFAIGLLSAYEPGRQMRRTLVGLSGGLVIGAAIWIAGVSDPNMGLRILLESAGGGMVVGASVVGREAESCEGSATPQIAQWR
jgi:hypothetical protein